MVAFNYLPRIGRDRKAGWRAEHAAEAGLAGADRAVVGSRRRCDRGCPGDGQDQAEGLSLARSLRCERSGGAGARRHTPVASRLWAHRHPDAAREATGGDALVGAHPRPQGRSALSNMPPPLPRCSGRGYVSTFRSFFPAVSYQPGFPSASWETFLEALSSERGEEPTRPDLTPYASPVMKGAM